MAHRKLTPQEVEERIIKKKRQKKFSLPVIGHFADRSVAFDSIIQAYEATGIHYSLIFESCIGKIHTAGKAVWEYKKGNHYIRYKAFYINHQEKFTRFSSFH